MRILVTGGCGFIGRHILERLDEHELLVVDNLSTSTKEGVTTHVEIADITDAKAIEHIFAKFKPEVVIHAAAHIQLRASFQNPNFDATQNILGTINVLEASRKHKVKKFIYTTSAARYGIPKRLPVKEDDIPTPTSPYGASKLSAEHYIEMYSQYGIDYLLLCFGNVYGPGDDPKMGRVTAVFTDALLHGRQPTIFGDGEQTRDFLYVKDIAEVIAHNLTTKTQHKLFNLAAGESTSVNRILNLVEKELGVKAHPTHEAAIAGEVREIIMDINLAKKELGFHPTLIEKGIKETVAWFKQP